MAFGGVGLVVTQAKRFSKAGNPSFQGHVASALKVLGGIVA